MRRIAAACPVLALALVMITGCSVVTATAPARSPHRLRLPAPTGPDRIGTVSLHLIDHSRTDPWVPAHPVRQIMIQIWYPAQDTDRYPVAPWMSPATAVQFGKDIKIPPGRVSWPLTAGHAGAPVDRRGTRYPVVIYSPGSHNDRSSDTALVEELASSGYVVVTIDHTHDASEVEFPDGRIEIGTLPPDTLKVNTEAVAVREADTRFVLNQLTMIDHGGNPDAEHRPLPTGIAGAFDLSKIGMFGHSIGGATAAATMHDDPRVKAGADLDGTLYGPVVTKGLDRPFLLMSSQGHGRETDPTWVSLWAHLHGWKRDLRLLGSAHSSYTDKETLLPQLVPLLGLTPSQVHTQLGTINPSRATTVERAYLLAFFDLQLHNHTNHLLDAPSPRYPEIRFLP